MMRGRKRGELERSRLVGWLVVAPIRFLIVVPPRQIAFFLPLVSTRADGIQPRRGIGFAQFRIVLTNAKQDVVPTLANSESAAIFAFCGGSEWRRKGAIGGAGNPLGRAPSLLLLNVISSPPPPLFCKSSSCCVSIFSPGSTNCSPSSSLAECQKE